MTVMNNQEMVREVSTDTVTCFLIKESYQLALPMHFKGISTDYIPRLQQETRTHPSEQKEQRLDKGFTDFSVIVQHLSL